MRDHIFYDDLLVSPPELIFKVDLHDLFVTLRDICVVEHELLVFGRNLVQMGSIDRNQQSRNDGDDLILERDAFQELILSKLGALV